MIKEGYYCIYHISLCKYYTGPLDPGIFGHDKSKTFFIKQSFIPTGRPTVGQDRQKCKETSNLDVIRLAL